MLLRVRSTWPFFVAFVVLAFIGAVSLAPEPATAGHGPFLTAQPAFITLTGPGTVVPIISSGETFHGFKFQGIPDGIGVAPGPNNDTVNVFINHEETTVPFFGSADFQDASVSKLTLLRTPGPNFGAVVDASVAIGPENGYLRFCSADMAGPEEGFSRYTFFTNEETNDVVDVPPGAPYGPDPSIAPQRQGGYAVVLDAASGAFRTVLGMGRHNHENTVPIPGGWNRFVMLSTDDTFSAPSSQLYMYMASRESHIWEDQGSLWAFRATRANGRRVNPNDPFNGANDYLDVQPGDDWQGEFIRVPKKIARGQTHEAPQAALENWSNEHNVFQFIRLEDVAWDRNDPRTVYIADTGATRIVPDPETGRMTRGPGGTVGFADNGRVFKMVLDEKNPHKVNSFSVLADGDAMGVPEAVPFRNPDNMDTSVNSLIVQEDTDEARIWRLDLATGTWSVIATVNDPDGESSGIDNVAKWFGPGWWLLDVQGHGMNVEEFTDPDGVLRKLESGQLMLMHIPGS